MRAKIITLMLIGILGAAAVLAKSPVRYMSVSSLGVEYTNLWRGQNITKATVPSHEQIQQFALNYAPVEYIQFLFGLGMDRFEVDPYGSFCALRAA
jgi:arginine exporter protein ArgO